MGRADAEDLRRGRGGDRSGALLLAGVGLVVPMMGLVAGVAVMVGASLDRLKRCVAVVPIGGGRSVHLGSSTGTPALIPIPKSPQNPRRQTHGNPGRLEAGQTIQELLV